MTAFHARLLADWRRKRDDWQRALDTDHQSPLAGERRATSREAYRALIAEADRHIAALEQTLGLRYVAEAA